MIEEGFYTNLSSEEYHGDKNSFSRSSLKDFYKSPYYYYSMHLNPDRPEKLATRDMILGSAFHTLVLEPTLFGRIYAVEPARVLLKDVGRDAYEAYKKQCEDLEKTQKIVLSSDEFITLHEMQASLDKNVQAQELMKDGWVETSFFWKDKDTDLMVKSRPDLLQHNMIIDLKTIGDASAHSFQRGMVDGWYHVQGAMVRDAIRHHQNKDISNVINICVEKKYPYCVAIYIIDEEALDYGEKLYKSILKDLKYCTINNDFKDYDSQIIGLPAWMKM